MCIRYKLCGHVSWNKRGLAMAGPAGAAPMTYDLLKQRAVGYRVDNFIMLLLALYSSLLNKSKCMSFITASTPVINNSPLPSVETEPIAADSLSVKVKEWLQVTKLPRIWRDFFYSFFTAIITYIYEQHILILSPPLLISLPLYKVMHY